MDEISMIDSGYILTDLFGRLQIKTVLLDYDYPRAFICSDLTNSRFYAFLENDDSEEHFCWNVTEVCLSDINSVNMGEKNLQSLFLDKDSFYVEGLKDSDLCIVKQVDSFEGQNRIEGDLFVSGFCDMDEVFDYHSLSKRAKKDNQSSISLIIEGENGHPKTGDILQAVKNLKEMCLNLDDSFDLNDSVLSVQAASTVLTFSFDERDVSELPYFSSYNNHERINNLGNILSSSEPEELINDAGENSKKVLKKYLNFMSYLNDMSKSKIVVASPFKDNAVSFSYNKNTFERKKKIVNKACKLLKTRMSVETKEIVVPGMLTGILTGEEKKFSFVSSESGKRYDGTVDFNLISSRNLFIVKGGISYATIKVTTTKKGDEVIKESYRLLSIDQSDTPQLNLFD